MKSATIKDPWWPWILTFALLVAFFLHLQGVPLFDLDEGAFSEASREMLANHDFLTTFLNGHPRYAKPILTYWFQVASIWLFGVHTFAFRLPSSLAATTWVLSTYGFLKPRLGREGAYTGALLMTLSAGIAVIGRAAIADALLNLFIALSLFDVWRYYESKKLVFTRRALLWMGLGFLTKGPIALIAVPTSLIYFLLQGRWRDWVRVVLDPWGWGIFLLLTLPWYSLEYLHQGKHFIDSFFLKNNIGRYHAPNDGHSGNYFYYFWVLPLMLMPFAGWFVSILPTAKKIRGDAFDQYLWIIFGFVFVFFTFSATKLPHYILYGVTPLIILMAKHRNAFKNIVLNIGPPIIYLVFVLALPWIVKQVAIHNHNLYIKALLAQGPSVFNSMYYAIPAISLLLIFLIWAIVQWPPWQKTLISGLLCTFVLMQTLVPAIGTIKQLPIEEAARIAKNMNLPTVMWHMNTPSFSVYRNAITPRSQPKPGDLVYTNINQLSNLSKIGPYKIIFSQGGIILALLEKHPSTSLLGKNASHA